MNSDFEGSATLKDELLNELLTAPIAGVFTIKNNGRLPIYYNNFGLTGETFIFGDDWTVAGNCSQSNNVNSNVGSIMFAFGYKKITDTLSINISGTIQEYPNATKDDRLWQIRQDLQTRRVLLQLNSEIRFGPYTNVTLLPNFFVSIRAE